MASMRHILLATLVLLAGCMDTTEAPLPRCETLGCPLAPSGTDGLWSPCTGEVCYCRDSNSVGAPDTECVPSR